MLSMKTCGLPKRIAAALVETDAHPWYRRLERFSAVSIGGETPRIQGFCVAKPRCSVLRRDIASLEIRLIQCQPILR